MDPVYASLLIVGGALVGIGIGFHYLGKRNRIRATDYDPEFIKETYFSDL